MFIGLGIGVASMFLLPGGAKPLPKQAATTPGSTTPATTDSPQKPAEDPLATAPEGATPDAAIPEPEAAGAQLPDLGVLAARTVDRADLSPLGGLEYQLGVPMRIEFTQLGAGVDSIVLADHFNNVKLAHEARTGNAPTEGQYEIQHRASAGGVSMASLATRAVFINGQEVDLYSNSGEVLWRETVPGAFVCEIENEAGEHVATIDKRFVTEDGSYDIRVEQTLTNHTDTPFDVEWVQYGPVDLPADYSGYRLDSRRVRFGYLRPISNDPSQQLVAADTKLFTRDKAIKGAHKGGDDIVLYPKPDRYKSAESLVWGAQTNRYFAFVIHPLIDTSNPAPDKSFWLASKEVDSRAIIDPYAPAKKSIGTGQPGRMVMQLLSRTLRVEPGATLDASFGAYAGPLGKKAMRGLSDRGIDPASDLYESLSLSGMVSYVMGMCAICTFQPLARTLLTVLTFFHDVLFHDWAISIMLLVVCVRGVLHPITKRSQISLQRFSKQMSALGPKQQKIREKYKDDQKRMQQEMMTLMKTEGVNYAGALGCLPMFLQTPVWIALYAMLYFAFELRHEPGFYGVFQSMSNGSWSFISDLSTADHFIDFGRTVATIPLIGAVSGINVLPLFLGVVFFLQQKYLQPPPSPSMTPEQQTQQKMMKVMMVVMFPVMMYNAPSGLTIYFITNSTLGILESRYIRSHVNAMDLEPKKKPQHGQLGRKKVKNTAKSPFGKDQGSTKTYKKRK
jgi:YidC/Oxa1 family membrane protein insertase